MEHPGHTDVLIAITTSSCRQVRCPECGSARVGPRRRLSVRQPRRALVLTGTSLILCALSLGLWLFPALVTQALPDRLLYEVATLLDRATRAAMFLDDREIRTLIEVGTRPLTVTISPLPNLAISSDARSCCALNLHFVMPKTSPTTWGRAIDLDPGNVSEDRP